MPLSVMPATGLRETKGKPHMDFDIRHFLFKLGFLHLCREGKDTLSLREDFALLLHRSSLKFLELVYTLQLGEDKL